MSIGDDLLAFKQKYLDPLNVVGHPLISDEDDPLGAREDLTTTPEYEMLRAAAEEFGRNYKEDRDNAQVARGQDILAIARLRAAEEGRTPSAAEALMRTAIDRNAGQALGAAAHAAPGMELRAGLEAQQRGAAPAAAGIGNMRAAELNAARQLLAESTGRARAIETQGAGATGNTLAGGITAPYKAKAREKAAHDARRASYMQFGAGLLANSDARGKRDIRPAPAMADDFLRSLPRREAY